MSKHTPGPWNIRHWDGNQQITITALGFRGPNVLALVRHPLTLIPPTPENDAKRSITEWECTEADVAEAEANARLIAAAPDLLEALQNLAEAAEHRDNTLGDPCRLFECKARLEETARKARITIAKATGQNGVAA